MTNPYEHLRALTCLADLTLDYAMKHYENASNLRHIVSNKCQSNLQNLEIHKLS